MKIETANNIYVNIKKLLLMAEHNMGSPAKNDFQKDVIKQKEKEHWINKQDMLIWLDNELSYEKEQKTTHNKGYFHAIKKIRRLINNETTN
jgi:hypothetical protein